MLRFHNDRKQRRHFLNEGDSQMGKGNNSQKNDKKNKKAKKGTSKQTSNKK
jgi:hypothetical protein